MLSGIGPKRELEEHGIKQIADLPVGQNLQDHPQVYAGFRINKPRGQMTTNSLSFLNPLNLAQFYLQGKGVWASNKIGAMGVMPTKVANSDQSHRPGEISSKTYIISLKSNINLIKSCRSVFPSDVIRLWRLWWCGLQRFIQLEPDCVVSSI